MSVHDIMEEPWPSDLASSHVFEHFLAQAVNAGGLKSMSVLKVCYACNPSVPFPTQQERVCRGGFSSWAFACDGLTAIVQLPAQVRSRLRSLVTVGVDTQVKPHATCGV